MIRTQLSTMEHTVLGILWQCGPCTTYAVMRELSASSSTYYRNRAGTAYPIIVRLVKGGLVRHAGDEVGSRKERLLEVTDNGLLKLQEWLAPPIPAAEIGQTRDLLRLRMYFLGALEPAHRARFLDDAKASLLLHLAGCEQAMQDHSSLADPFVALADLGAVHETRARLAWLEEITLVVLSL